MSTATYNPLEKLNLARSIEAAILASDAVPLGSPQPVSGAGVYVVYYRGPLPLYSPLALANEKSWERPIYVGKAIPKGGRKGGLSHDAVASRTAIFSRLRKHADSIRATADLDIADFAYRALVLDDIWIPLGENILIETFKPLWNVVIEGFGINDPGRGRQGQQQSAWDAVHPGRKYAMRLVGGAPGLEAVRGRVADYFENRPLRRLPKIMAALRNAPTA